MTDKKLFYMFSYIGPTSECFHDFISFFDRLWILFSICLKNLRKLCFSLNFVTRTGNLLRSWIGIYRYTFLLKFLVFCSLFILKARQTENTYVHLCFSLILVKWSTKAKYISNQLQQFIQSRELLVTLKTKALRGLRFCTIVKIRNSWDYPKHFQIALVTFPYFNLCFYGLFLLISL